MRILVFFRVTPDLEMLRGSDWAAGEGISVGAHHAWESRPETRFAQRVFDCFDESALEVALRLRDATPGGESDAGAPSERRVAAGSGLAALSIGGREIDRHLMTLGALGYDPLIRVNSDAELDFAPHVAAALIAASARRRGGCDLLILGCRGSLGGGEAVPFLAAEALGWPCLAPVVEAEPLSDGRIRVTCDAHDGHLKVTVSPPCVLAVGNAVASRLRVPTLADRLARKDMTVDVLSPEELGVDLTAGPAGGGCVLTGLEVIDRRREGAVVQGATPAEKALVLFDSYLRERLEQL